MKTYILKTEQTVTYRVEVEAENLEDAIHQVESGQADDYTEIDSSGDCVTEWAFEGVMGWNPAHVGENAE